MVRARRSTVQSIASIVSHASEEWKPEAESSETKQLQNPLLNTDERPQSVASRHRSSSLPVYKVAAESKVLDYINSESYLFPFTQAEEDALTESYFHKFSFNSVLDYKHISTVNACYDDQLLSFQADCDRNIEYFQSLLKETNDTMNELSSLTLHHDQVVKDTEDFANQSRDLLNKQTELGKKAVEMDHVMEMFEPLESISRTLSSSGTSIIKSGRWRSILVQLHETLNFFSTHKSYKDAEVYSMRYRQCITRALTLMRNFNIDFLKYKLMDVSARLNKGDVDALKLDIMMYSEFGSDLDKQTENTKFPTLIQAIADQCTDHREYQGLISDVMFQYFKLRRVLVHAFLQKQVLSSLENYSKGKAEHHIQNPGQLDVVKYCQKSISQFKRLVEKEYTMFCRYFPLDNFDDVTRQFVDQELYTFLKQLLEPLYDDMRNKILKETSITELSHLTNLLATYYELDDDTASIVSNTHSKIEYGALLEPIINDSQARLIFRIQNYIDNKLVKYKPRPEDLLLGNRKKSSGRISVLDEFEANLFPELYVPVGKALTILSNLYELINSMVFDDIAHYIIHSCIFMLKNGAMDLAISHLGYADAKLFYLKNLTMLKNHLNTFDIQFVRTETSLDLTGGIQELIRIFRSGSLSVSLNSQGGFLELAKKSAPKVVNDMIDAKKEIESELSNTFNDFITDCTNVICEPILHDDGTSLAEKNNKLSDNVLMKVPHIHKQVSAYIAQDEFVTYLLSVLSRLIYSTYESYHRTVEQKMASSGHADELNEIMEPETFFNFLAETIAGLQEFHDIRQETIDYNEDNINASKPILEITNEISEDLSPKESEVSRMLIDENPR